MKKSQKVDAYLEKQKEWREPLNYLRSIILETELEETMKWSIPTYTIQGKNVVSLVGFKSYFGIWFFQGALLEDKLDILVASEDKTKAQRQMRFVSSEEIDSGIVRTYLNEAIRNQKAGREIKPESKRLSIPKELETSLEEDKALRESFDSLTSGKQKEYADYVAGAKREATRKSRLEKIIPMIKEGIGLNDQYK